MEPTRLTDIFGLTIDYAGTRARCGEWRQRRAPARRHGGATPPPAAGDAEP